jgi:hypothetical protein
MRIKSEQDDMLGLLLDTLEEMLGKVLVVL